MRGKSYSFGKGAKRVNGQPVRIEGDGRKEVLEEHRLVPARRRGGKPRRTLAYALV